MWDVKEQYVVLFSSLFVGCSGTDGVVCGFEYKNAADGSGSEQRAFPIVGLDHLGHGSKDPEIKRLKQLDPDREGLMVRLAGGQYIDKKKERKNAGALIEFQCDPTRSGLEGLTTTDDRDEETKHLQAREGDDKSGDKSQSLQFKSFGPSDDDSYVLKLDWKTRYACDDYLSSKKGDSSRHWGFFTWFIVMYVLFPLLLLQSSNLSSLFLCIAAYLIFGSWLNYNRYGARGWDLLPHNDTIRDVPYILQDWFRRVVSTFQGTGGGSRAGYSAV